MVRSKFLCFVLAIMASGCGRGFSVEAMESGCGCGCGCVEVVEPTNNVNCIGKCPNKTKKNDLVLYLFKNGKQSHYYLCMDCVNTILKLNGLKHTYVPLSALPISLTLPSWSRGDGKYRCPKCEGLSYFVLKFNDTLSFCIRCNTCFNNENKEKIEGLGGMVLMDRQVNDGPDINDIIRELKRRKLEK